MQRPSLPPLPTSSLGKCPGSHTSETPKQQPLPTAHVRSPCPSQGNCSRAFRVGAGGVRGKDSADHWVRSTHLPLSHVTLLVKGQTLSPETSGTTQESKGTMEVVESSLGFCRMEQGWGDSAQGLTAALARRMPAAPSSGRPRYSLQVGAGCPRLVSINLALHQLQTIPQPRQCPELLGSQPCSCNGNDSILRALTSSPVCPTASVSTYNIASRVLGTRGHWWLLELTGPNVCSVL